MKNYTRLFVCSAVVAGLSSASSPALAYTVDEAAYYTYAGCVQGAQNLPEDLKQKYCRCVYNYIKANNITEPEVIKSQTQTIVHTCGQEAVAPGSALAPD